MSRKIISCVILFAFFTTSFGEPFAFAQATNMGSYLMELGITYYKNGEYEEALSEFKKLLLVEPDNEVAQEYINSIFAGEKDQSVAAFKLPPQRKFKEEKSLTRNQIIDQAFVKLNKQESPYSQPQEEKKAMEVFGVKITGQAQASLGIAPGESVIWKRANADLNEENYRILSTVAYNQRSNTFDPRIYDRLRIYLDRDVEEGFNLHADITMDPWSYLGKTEKVNIIGAGGQDVAQIEVKTWSNTGYTVNEAFHTLEMGDSFALPEVKVVKGHTAPFSITSLNGNIFNIPELTYRSSFQPLREIWVEYKSGNANFRFFPLAYEKQAFTTDDPLQLSGHRSWWEESPWLSRWVPGIVNSGLTPVDFTPGGYDNSMAYLLRDSDNQRLNTLRGFAFSFSPTEELSFSNTFAFPKDPWQEYMKWDNLIDVLRIKYQPMERFKLGYVYSQRYGVTENFRRDATNQVFGWDGAYEIKEGLKFSMEISRARTRNDLSTSYATKVNGNAYYFFLEGRYPNKKIINSDNGYYGIKREKDEPNFSKFRAFLCRMDDGFTTTLANYHQTRDDAFWSRHIQFRRPFDYYQSGLYGSSMSMDDVMPYRLGDGIDTGRDAFGLRLENSFGYDKIEHLFDFRNVHKVNGKFVENVARDEVSYKIDDKITAKFLAISHQLPRTKGGKDPFVTDSTTGEFVNNASIPDGKDPSTNTWSIGADYNLFTDFGFFGVWERTNDYNLAYDNFPRGNLSGTSFTTESIYNKLYRVDDPFLYSQGFFPLPPYSYYNIWKTGLKFSPTKGLQIGLDYTRNDFESAGQIDDNINHVGFEAAFMPTKRYGFLLKYVFSRWNDLTNMTQGYAKDFLSHHNFFSEFRYMPTEDSEFVLQYGEAGRSNVATQYSDPFSAGLPVLDTRHIFRMYYRRKF